MAGKILGYEIASPEQQKRTATIIFGFIGGVIVLGAFVYFYIAFQEQRGRVQAMATVTAAETKCRYVVRNISKRVSYYDHTGYIGCAEAEEVARENNSTLGRVEKVTFADVSFVTADGRQVASHVELHRQTDVATGSQVEILYREDTPSNVTEFKEFAFAGKSSIKSSEAAPTADDPGQRQRKPFPWRGLLYLIILLAAAYWVLKRIWRLAKRLLGRDSAAPVRGEHRQLKATAPRQASAQIPRGRAAAPADRMARVVNRGSRAGFGQR